MNSRPSKAFFCDLVICGLLCMFMSGCASFDPRDNLEDRAYRSEDFQRHRYRESGSLLGGLLDGYFESRDYKQSVKDYKNRGYDDTEARKRAFEEDFFKRMQNR